MRRFFFDLDDGEVMTRDEEGIELDDVATARTEALRVLPDLARDELLTGHCRTFASSVRDETGKVVFKASLSLHAEFVD